MTDIQPKITYSIIQQQFSGFEISEAHGMLVALLCGSSFECYSTWLSEIENISDHDATEFNEEVLKILYDKTVEELKSKDFALSLLIPDEGDFLARIDGFINWCHGFLYGFGISGIHGDQLDEDSRDFIDYMTDFTKLNREDLAGGMESKEDELALEELIEFVRMSSLMVFYQIKNNETIH